MRKVTFTLAAVGALAMLAACGDADEPAAPEAAATGAITDSGETAEAAPPPEPVAVAAPPMGYDQAVRCVYLADWMIRDADAQTSGLTTDQLATLMARAREAAYAAAPREQRQANIDGDMRELLRESAISAGPPRGSSSDPEENRRIEERWQARAASRNAEINGTCARLLG